jgi:2-iminobutanoate/2-iminopropanoate deaminase
MPRIEGSTKGAPKPAGPYSQAIRNGPVVSVAGMVGVDPTTRNLVGDDVGSQTIRALANAEAALLSCGATMSDVVRTDVYLASMTDLPAMNAAYESVFRPPYPTRTTVGVDLPNDYKVEVTVFAVVMA